MADFPERIMHIDDSEMEHMMVEAAFDSMPDLTVKSCNSGAEGLAALEEIKPQLILLDLKMPEMDGPETLNQIRKAPGFEHVPVIFLTAAEKVVMAEEYENLGVIGVIHKPIRPATLVESITELWRSYSPE